MRDLTSGKEKPIGDDALRIRTDGGRRLIGLNDLQTHESVLEVCGSRSRWSAMC